MLPAQSCCLEKRMEERNIDQAEEEDDFKDDTKVDVRIVKEMLVENRGTLGPTVVHHADLAEDDGAKGHGHCLVVDVCCNGKAGAIEDTHIEESTHGNGGFHESIPDEGFDQEWSVNQLIRPLARRLLHDIRVGIFNT